MEESNKKGKVCVTGGTGFLGSWMVKRLLEHGYSVNTTIRDDPERKRDISYLTNLPGASERLQVFEADLDRPDSFAAAIEGCVGVFHVAHPMDLAGKEAEEVKIKRAVSGIQGILQACVDSETVKRVVYTSSITTVFYNEKAAGSELVDESSWTDADFCHRLGENGTPYVVAKTLTERTALDFAEKHGLDLVTMLPSWINGPFICTRCPDSVRICMALIFADKKYYQRLTRIGLVHIDDVVRAHIRLFECPNAKGRYICSATEITIDVLHEFLSDRYPEFELAGPDSWKDLTPAILPDFSSKKLLETGFQYENGLEEMFDGAIKCCKEKGLL
uniref:Dihydroflavonol 4-reductase n=1 Tax=Callicarpa americana TaxID=204211 RepID=A0A9Y1LMZ5_CALAM|nr:oxidoreductase 13 [Callicarpa americana]